MSALIEEEGRHPGCNTGYLASVPEYPNGDPMEVDPILFAGDDLFRGRSDLREHMANRVAKLKMARPASNKIKPKSNVQPLVEE